MRRVFWLVVLLWVGGASAADDGILDPNGFIRSWLMLGPLDTAAGCAPPETLGDYLTDGGAITQENVLPRGNDDDGVNIADAIKILGYLFSGDSMIGPDNSTILPGDTACTAYPEASVTALDGGCQEPCMP